MDRPKFGKKFRDNLGRVVREVWVEEAAKDPNPKPHHLLSWDELDERNKEIDCLIGERIMYFAIEMKGDE